MAETINRGPNMGLGAMIGNVTTGAGLPVGAVEPTDGPSITYQGDSFPDPRYYPADKDGQAMGRIPAFSAAVNVVLVDAIPSASTATPQDIAANQATTSGTAMTLVSAQPSATSLGQCAHMPSTPMVPFGAQAPVTVFGLDMGFVYGTTVAGSPTVTVVDSSAFFNGQWVVIGGAGNVGATIPLIAQVVNAAASGTTITISPAALGAVTRAPIANGNAYTGFPGARAANAVSPYLLGGVGRFFNPAEAVCRVVGINAAAGAAGGIFTVRGYDMYGVPMTEAITVGAGAAVAYGNKAFKYITSVTPNVTDAVAHYGVGVGDVIGLNIRSAQWELLTAYVAQAQLAVATGWKAGLATVSGPSTTTTADTRGSLQVGTRGNSTGTGSAGATGGPFSSTVRVAVIKTVSAQGLISATPNNYTSLFGVAQV